MISTVRDFKVARFVYSLLTFVLSSVNIWIGGIPSSMSNIAVSLHERENDIKIRNKFRRRKYSAG